MSEAKRQFLALKDHEVRQLRCEFAAVEQKLREEIRGLEVERDHLEEALRKMAEELRRTKLIAEHAEGATAHLVALSMARAGKL